MRLCHTIVALLPVLLFAGCASEPADPPPKAPPSRKTEIDVDVVTIRSTNVPSEIRQRMETVRVTGLSDPDQQERINRRLRELPEKTLDELEANLTDSALGSPDLPQTTRLRSIATVGLRGPELLSASFRYEANGGELGRAPGLSYDSITIDLSTGKVLSSRDLLARRVHKPGGARALGRLLEQAGPEGELCGPRPAGARELRPSDFISDNPREQAVWLFPGQDDVTFALSLTRLGYPMSCARQNIVVDYPRLREFLAPEIRRD